MGEEREEEDEKMQDARSRVVSSHIKVAAVATIELGARAAAIPAAMLRPWSKPHVTPLHQPQQTRKEKQCTYPVPPVARVVTICLTVKVLHHVDTRRRWIGSGCVLWWDGGFGSQLLRLSGVNPGVPITPAARCSRTRQCRRWWSREFTHQHGSRGRW